MNNPKPKRIVDEEALEEARNQHCLACGRTPCDPHHLTTRGAGGGDTPDNLLPVCRKHHAEIHQIGVGKFSWKYPKLKEWLNKNQRFDILNKIYGD